MIWELAGETEKDLLLSVIRNSIKKKNPKVVGEDTDTNNSISLSFQKLCQMSKWPGTEVLMDRFCF